MRNKKIYFLGIGGIGMSALAQYFMQEGCDVFGYDLTPSPITEMLIRKGAHIHYQPDVNLIPEDLDFAVYTPAIRADFPEFSHLENCGVTILKRSQALGVITENFMTVAVAGTHGKTTTTSMIAHLFRNNTDTLLAFIGGISKNFDDNYFYQDVKDSDIDIAVVEADEYDRSFLTLHPEISIITSIDPDHLDIYKNDENLLDAFQQFANQSEFLIVEENVADKIQKNPAKKTVYGLSECCDCYPYNIRHSGDETIFDIHTPFADFKGLKTSLHGIYNILNFTAAISAFLLKSNISKGRFHDNKIPTEEIVGNKISTFLGVKRRFEYIVKRDDFVFIDDYAHHPNEMKAFFNAVRNLYRGKKICGIFQPHLYSRTKDFADDFAEALNLLDKVILLPIYPAREAPIPGINSEFLLEKIAVPDKTVLQKDELADYLTKNRPDILLTVGAGDIDRLVPQIAESI